MKINSSEKSNEHDGMPKIILASNNVLEKIGCQQKKTTNLYGTNRIRFEILSDQ
jgi:hypothetical protein